MFGICFIACIVMPHKFYSYELGCRKYVYIFGHKDISLVLTVFLEFVGVFLLFCLFFFGRDGPPR